MLCLCLAIAFAADPGPGPEPKKETPEALTKRLAALPARAMKEAKTDAGLVELLFQETLKRAPKREEAEVGLNYFAKGKGREAATRDLVRALVNTKEFAVVQAIPFGELPGLSQKLSREWAAAKK